MTPPAAISHGSIRRAARDDEIAIEHISEGSSRYSDDVATRTNTRADEMGMNEKVEGVSTVTNAPLSLTSEEVADFQPNPDGDVQHGPFRKKWEKIRGWKYWRGVLHLGLWVLLTRYVLAWKAFSLLPPPHLYWSTQPRLIPTKLVDCGTCFAWSRQELAGTIPDMVASLAPARNPPRFDEIHCPARGESFPIRLRGPRRRRGRFGADVVARCPRGLGHHSGDIRDAPDGRQHVRRSHPQHDRPSCHGFGLLGDISPSKTCQLADRPRRYPGAIPRGSLRDAFRIRRTFSDPVFLPPLPPLCERQKNGN